MRTFPVRVCRVPWDQVIAPSDLVPQASVFSKDCRPDGKPERHYGLPVIGTFGISLGILGIRCERRGEQVIPLSLMIADEPFSVDTITQRWLDQEDGA